MEIVLETFEKIVKCFKFQPQIDLFASRHNNQVKKYIAWTLDPSAWAVDAFNFLVKYWLLCFSSFQYDWENSLKDNRGQIRRDHTYFWMEHSVLHGNYNETDCEHSNQNLLFSLNAEATVQQRENSFSRKQCINHHGFLEAWNKEKISVNMEQMAHILYHTSWLWI